VNIVFTRDELAGACPVRMAYWLLEGYYRFLKAPVAARKVRRLVVEDAVVCTRAESRRIYSAPKIALKPPHLGESAHRNTSREPHRSVGSRYPQRSGARRRRRAAMATEPRSTNQRATSPPTARTEIGCETSPKSRRTNAACTSLA
jgi:hypothetical protein